MARPRAQERDGGFTLLEVVVAMLLLGVVSTAALAMTVSGMKDSTALQQRQIAITLANQALEQARAVNPARRAAATRAGVPAVTISGLVVNRNTTDVQAQWSTVDATAVPDVSLTWPASDPSAVPVAGLPLAPPSPLLPVVPLSSTQALGGQSYSITTLIGTCYRLRTDTATAACTKRATAAGAEPTGDTTLVQLLRVIAVVTWQPSQDTTCPSAGCTYTTSELIDPHDDLTWNPGGNLVAVDDTATVSAGSTTTLRVLANDQGTFSPTNPVSIAHAPASGTASVDSSGVVTFTAPNTPGATVTFSYTVTNSDGAVSDPATVTVKVTS